MRTKDEFEKGLKGLENRIFYRVINTKNNERVLNRIPHTEVLNLSKIYYTILIDETAKTLQAITITNAILAEMSLTIEALDKIAERNTIEVFMPQLECIDAVIDNLDLRGALDSDEKMKDFYILTNKLYLYGASCIFYPDLMEDLSHFFGNCSLYVIPSSINEAILMPDYGIVSKRELEELLMMLNDSITDNEERLSDDIFYYCHKTNQLSIV